MDFSKKDGFENEYKAVGRSEFTKARMQAFWNEMFGLLRDKSVRLWSFDEVKSRLRLRSETYRGLQDIYLDRIVGSVGRYDDFTQEFLPKKSMMQERWSRVYAAINSMEGVPPIEVYQVDDVYFVRDGNHRVSIARHQGNKTIQAYVTELHTPIDLEPGMSEKEWLAAEAYADFLGITNLNQTRPNQKPIVLTEPSRYQELLDHIQLARDVMRYREKREVSVEEAAVYWYDRVYAPAVDLMRKYNVLEVAPSRSEGDLYLWLTNHLRQMHEHYGEDGQPLRISDALVDYLSSRKVPIPPALVKERDRPLDLRTEDRDESSE